MNDQLLGPGWDDRRIALIRALAGMVPGLGPIFAELIDQVLPNYRIERLEKFVEQWGQAIAALEQDHAEILKQLKTQNNVDLFEEGAFQSVRAVSDERIKRIARLVASGISEDEGRSIETKRLLRLLSEIDDQEIIVLMSYLDEYRGDRAFHQRHQNIFDIKRDFIGAPKENTEFNAMRNLMRIRLKNLGLLEINKNTTDKSIDTAVWSDLEMIKKHGAKVTPIGRLLLDRMGLI